jgi:hypothetical protein
MSFQPGIPTPYRARKSTDVISRGPVQSRVVRDAGMCRRSLYGNREDSRVTAYALHTGLQREGEEAYTLRPAAKIAAVIAARSGRFEHCCLQSSLKRRYNHLARRAGRLT